MDIRLGKSEKVRWVINRKKGNDQKKGNAEEKGK